MRLFLREYQVFLLERISLGKNEIYQGYILVLWVFKDFGTAIVAQIVHLFFPLKWSDSWFQPIYHPSFYTGCVFEASICTCVYNDLMTQKTLELYNFWFFLNLTHKFFFLHKKPFNSNNWAKYALEINQK